LIISRRKTSTGTAPSSKDSIFVGDRKRGVTECITS
jgi:hypothetical protein